MMYRATAVVREAMDSLPRADFLPDSLKELASLDRPLPIGQGQTNSQPSTVAIMVDLLEVQPGQKVLDVGAGSGWTTAILSKLVGPTGSVLGVERQASLIPAAQEAIARHGGNAEIRLALPGVLGWPDTAPFDRILVSAEADALPETLVNQMGDDAILVIPVGSRMLRVRKHNGSVTVTSHGLFTFVPLIVDPLPKDPPIP